MIRIQGERVVLRPFRPEEIDTVWEMRLASTTTGRVLATVRTAKPTTIAPTRTIFEGG